MASILRDPHAVAAAAAEATSYGDLCERLGLSRRGANIARAQAACKEAGVTDLPKMARSQKVSRGTTGSPPKQRGAFQDRDRLATAIDGAGTRHEILTRLGVAPVAKHYRKLEAAADRFAFTLPPVRPNAAGQRRGPLPRRLPTKWNAEAVKQAAEGATSTTEVLARLGTADAKPYQLRKLRAVAEQHGIELPRGTGIEKRRRDALEATLVKLVEHGTFIPGQRLRTHLVAAGLLIDQCSECGTPPMWNGRALVLQLDHINGVPTDNRRENLRLLCPNCHSQTETFAGRNLKPRGMV